MVLPALKIVPGSIGNTVMRASGLVQLPHVTRQPCFAVRMVDSQCITKKLLICLSQVLGCGLADHVGSNQEKYSQRDRQRRNRPYGDFQRYRSQGTTPDRR